MSAELAPVYEEERGGLPLYVCRSCTAWCRPNQRIHHAKRCETPTAQWVDPSPPDAPAPAPVAPSPEAPQKLSPIQWWAAVLKRDGEHGDPASLLRCVFCGKDMAPERQYDGSEEGNGAAMLAWWMDWDGEVGGPIVAAGLYCVGRQVCLISASAPAVGRRLQLLDVHADAAVGARAMPTIERILRDFPLWEPEAVRRLCLIGCLLSRKKSTKAQRARRPA